MANFSFDVQHRAGVKHCNADGLSRAGFAEEPSDEEEVGCMAMEEDNGDDNSETRDTDLPIPATTPVQPKRRNDDMKQINPTLYQQRFRLEHTRDDVRRHQTEDEALSLARRWVREKSSPSAFDIKGFSRVGKIYAGLLDQLVLDKSDVLCIKLPATEGASGVTATCLPSTMWDDTIRSAHVAGGHMAAETTLLRLRRSVYFPGMLAEVKGYINCCLPCQAKARKQPDQRHTLVSPLSGYPFQQIHVDFVGPLNEGRRTKSKWLLTVRDSFSKWIEVIPMVQATAVDTVRALEREVFARFGLPESMHTDCGAQFKGRLFLAVGQMLGIKITDTTGYNPKSNGQVERMHRDLGPMLRALILDKPESWEDVLPQALFALRTAVCRSTGLAPFQILFGRDVSQPLDLIFGAPRDVTIDGTQEHHEYLRQFRKRIDTAQAFVRNNLRKAVSRQRRQYHEDKKTFLTGAKVWLFTPTTKPGMPRKLSKFWTGPWTICATPVNSVMVRLAPHPSWTNFKGSKVVSIDRIKLYLSASDEQQPPDEDDDILMEGDEFAEAVSNQPSIPETAGDLPFFDQSDQNTNDTAPMDDQDPQEPLFPAIPVPRPPPPGLPPAGGELPPPAPPPPAPQGRPQRQRRAPDRYGPYVRWPSTSSSGMETISDRSDSDYVPTDGASDTS